MDPLLAEKLRSRKLWVALLGVAVVVALGLLDVEKEQAAQISQWVVAIVSAYLLGQGYADGKTQAAAQKPLPGPTPADPAEPSD